jgi:uncharacterized protein (DUF58 family)
MAVELAAILAFLAIKNNDKVGLVVFSDHVEHFIPPKKGRSHVWQIIRSVLTHEGKGKKTDLGEATQSFLRLQKRKSQCFVISDFRMDAGMEKQLQVLKRQHELICVATSDPREEEMVGCGLIDLEDAETGETMVVDTNDRRFRHWLKQAEEKRSKDLQGFMRRNKIDFFSIATHQDIVKPLASYLRQRERVKRS